MMITRLVFLLTCAALLTTTSYSLTGGFEDVSDSEHSEGLLLESFEGEYKPVPAEDRRTSPAYRYSSSLIFTTQVNVIGVGENIVGDAANEPSIAVDPTNSDRMAIGWRQFDTVESNFRQAGWAFSVDGGQEWIYLGVLDPGTFRSDPVLVSDAEGNFYYNSLASTYEGMWCDVFRSTDGGMTWDEGTFAQGGDKQWMVIDTTGGIGRGNHYAFWTSFYSICEPGQFTRSTDGGASYEDCDTIPGNPYWGGLSVGPDGDLFVCGASDTQFVVARSTNAQVPTEDVSWDLSTGVSLGGSIAFAEGPNPDGLLGQPWIATDHSDGPSRGNVYMLGSVAPYSGNDPLDIMFTMSTDGGVTWSAPIRVNDDADTTAYQWFGTMSVAPDGRIDAIWLDTRVTPDDNISALYYSYSTDAGANWSQNEQLSEPFDSYLGWPQQQKMGDYFDMVSDDSGIHLAWAATFNGEQDVYYSHITPDVTGVEDQEPSPAIPKSFTLSQNYPNPFNPATTIEFSVSGETGAHRSVNLAIYDIRGRLVRTLIDAPLAGGTHRIHWDGLSDRSEPVPSGIYLARLRVDGEDLTRKMTLLK